ncbi:MAG TPA: polysaccharide deacetylase family protein, partial [Opitutus sp.]|nr:polysaccharide deacetylase family protein [Opitutus sp.]
DAIAAEFAWPILQRFFEKNLYPQFTTWRKDDGWHVRRGELQLGSALPGNGKISWAEVHDQIGWTVFLQEAWGDSTRLAKQFYSSQPDRTASPVASAGETAPDWLVIEISDPLAVRSQLRPRVGAVLTAGGAVVASTRSVAGPGTISAVALQAALTTEAGFELCCACIREAVIGRRFDEPVSLRMRLAERAAQRPLLSPLADVAVLPRRAGPCGSSASRRAALPTAVLPEIQRWHAQPVRTPLPFSTENTAPSRVLYLPDLATGLNTHATARMPSKTSQYDGAFFEDLFHQNSNPWHYDTPYEQTKYDQTLALLPPRRFGRALELACAEGHFTQRLATRVDALLATDISPTALQRAASRCREHANVSFKPLDLVADPLPGTFDLIVCSEVLYFLGTVQNLRHVLAKIARALKPGGCFVTAHAHLVADEPHRPGFDWDLPFGAKKISDVLANMSQLRLVRDLRTPMYRVQVYERQSPLRRWLPRRAPQRALLSQPTELPPHAASHAQWRGGVPQRLQGPPKVKTERLPILMYHHVSPDSVGHLDRYRVTPRQFEEQLQFLAERGYRSVSLEEWRRASVARTPLPGRCVAITFDDGYRNFLEHAWPLLLRYGFTATMFVPTRDIGTSDRWENELANGTPLLSWDQLRKLRNEGLEIGSHSHVHPMLTSLSPTEVAREALLSRTLIDEHLGTGVTSFAYPYGEYDRVVERVIGGCGYTFALTCEERPAELQDRLLALPRIEVRGDCTRGDFADLLPET